ncbi:hypothetical protein [Alienimonas sp. DA493]|uniref:hypothetical protein n=1 Tax=Alienimonas sp. DA493 TaxID=3373605 RepID=UPI0037553C82
MSKPKKKRTKTKIKVPPGHRLIWRPWITVNGKRIHASERGIKAFPIVVPVAA